MSQASHAKFATEVDAIKSQVRVRRAETDSAFSGTLNDFLGTTSKYDNKLIMQEGELVYVANAVSSKEAKWFEELGIQKSSDYYLVQFDTAGGNEIDSQSIKIGKTAKKPKNPTKEGHVFLGWYYLQESGTEDNLTYEEKEFDFNTKILSNYSLYAKYSGEAVIMAVNRNKAFWQETYRTKITSIVFTKDSSLIPSSPINSWNVEADKNCANIKAYIIKDETDNSLYKLIVYSDYTIYANPNTSAFFWGFTRLQSITFDNFDTSKTTTMRSMFNNCKELLTLDINMFNTRNVSTMYAMFVGCKKLNSINLSNINTINVTSMYQMFSGCSSLTSLDLSDFDTSNVTSMNQMFIGCSKLENLNLSIFNTKKVINMAHMFSNCKMLKILDVSNFDTSSVTTMRGMFNECNSLGSLDISNFNTSNVTAMCYMFFNCYSLTNLDLSIFNTKNVTDMASMFYNCKSLTNLNIDNFNTENVTDMSMMFYNCKELTSLDVSKFNTSNVTKMNGMFFRCNKVRSLYLNNFDTSNVTNMRAMFSEMNEITSLDISSFNTSNVTIMDIMFSNSKKVTTIYVGEKWSTSNLADSDNMFYNCTSLIGEKGTKYNSNKPRDKTYAHVDEGISNPGYFTFKK